MLHLLSPFVLIKNSAIARSLLSTFKETLKKPLRKSSFAESFPSFIPLWFISLSALNTAELSPSSLRVNSPLLLLNDLPLIKSFHFPLVAVEIFTVLVFALLFRTTRYSLFSLIARFENAKTEPLAYRICICSFAKAGWAFLSSDKVIRCLAIGFEKVSAKESALPTGLPVTLGSCFQISTLVGNKSWRAN